MNILKNIFAIIGVLALASAGALYAKVSAIMGEFDPEASRVYMEFATTMLETKDPADAMVWKVQVEEDIGPEDVKESLKSIATENNFLFVGESPFYKQVEAITGKPFRHIAFMNFCDARVGMQMANYNDAYTAFMPCTVSVVEDQQGKLWIYAMNMDLLIYGGKSLPPDLKKNALKVAGVIRSMMNGAAKGEF